MTTDTLQADTAAIADLFHRANIPFLRVEAEGEAFVVTVEPQPNVLGRVKKLYDAMTNAKFSVNYGVRVSEGQHYYTLTRRLT